MTKNPRVRPTRGAPIPLVILFCACEFVLRFSILLFAYGPSCTPFLDISVYCDGGVTPEAKYGNELGAPHVVFTCGSVLDEFGEWRENSQSELFRLRFLRRVYVLIALPFGKHWVINCAADAKRKLQLTIDQ
ncbi:MAG: hypothetical protein JWN92_22 [Candidatus Acidoferrum typicum]|jgi:hypothetical protein|nr:hypothetical protein [Candidatus Acidoferrum typicum]